LNITKNAASPARRFFDRYQGTGSIRLHCDALDLSGQRLRHHGIDINVEAMLESEDFRNAFVGELQRIDRAPAAVVLPPHRAGVGLADLASRVLTRKFGIEPPKIVHPDLSPDSSDVPRNDIQMLNADSLLLIIDDVSCTGRRLKRYQVNLRELGYIGRIFYVIGVARPESDDVWNTRVSELTLRDHRPEEPHIVASAEKVVLPNWDAAECPWCLELEALKSLYTSIDTRDARRIVSRRLTVLDRAMRGQGLIDNAIWRTVDGAEPHLTIESVFLTNRAPTDADVIASVGAALQQMRTWNKPRRLEGRYPHVMVVNPANYLGESPRFNDDILRLAILRVAKREELERWDSREEIKRAEHVFQELLSANAGCDAVRLELAVAMIAGKLPTPSISESGWEQLADVPYEPLLREVLRRAE
jgi:hypothetical protein